MYLKSIEIQGFKSFANKTLFEFHNGITGIVGPNGSGKSNVADAVRWVLGEQSAKQLRGSSMQDVIFAGTEQRKPQGFASVAITFDNSDHVLNVDFDEVTVTRRVFRSGESEYMLNQTPCRLRDINELFFDTGIGKEGYSIIGQGQIDRILSTKPDERRELFDEAAGIVKYKYRKNAAMKRLTSEQENMVRLTDIMSELEQRVGPLQKQSENAREYLKLHDALREREINAFVLESRQGEESLKKTLDRLEIVTGDFEARQADIENLRKEYASGEQALADADAAIEEVRTRQEKLKAALQEREGQILVLKEQIRTEELRTEHAESRKRQLEERASERADNRKETAEKRQELNRQIYDAQSSQAILNRRAEELQEKLSDAQQLIRSGQSRVIGLLNRKTELAADLQKYDTLLEQLRIQKSQLTGDLLKSGTKEQETSEELKRREATLAKRQETLEKGRRKLSELDALLRGQRREFEDLQNAYGELRRAHQASLTRQESLRNLAERYEGYGNAIRRVMEERSSEPGICGVVADLFHVEKEYETAIETALGGSIQNIVTDTEQTAKRLIGFLKKNRHGRATFLPLDAITKTQDFHQREVLKEEGIIGLASGLVRTEKRYDSVREFLLGRIVVADTIDHAMRVSAKYKRTLRIVTLEGDLLNPGGSMTGGAYRNSSNLLGRNREMEALEKQIAGEKEKLEKQKRRLEQLSGSIGNLDRELSELRQNAEDDRLKETAERMRLDAEKEQLEQIQRDAGHTRAELLLLEQSVKEAMQKRSEVLEESGQVEKDQSLTQTASEESIAKSESWQDELKEVRAGLQEQELVLARLSQSDAFLSETLLRLSEEERGEGGELESLNNDLENSREAVSGLNARIASLSDENVQAGEALTACVAQLEVLTKDRERKNSDLRGFFEKQEELSGQLRLLDREQNTLENQKNRQEERLNDLTENLWTEYELNPSQAKALFSENGVPLQELRKEIKALKEQVKKLGPVNVSAIEEYAEVSERYEFMKKQYDDLEVSRKMLLDVIEELDRGMREQFTEQFALIREEFDRVFKELFGGGKGTIELVEGEDILEAGISIISQPPGKKLQNMMQLSGGEKALTAIALLFAIQNLKPSPFCLLDEIEAALDDSNVGRFAGYLHKLTAHTQFIVITHRRGTMSSADRLYGITMQEKGVSALVSVNLIENELS